MKITKNELTKIINEELTKLTLSEAPIVGLPAMRFGAGAANKEQMTYLAAIRDALPSSLRRASKYFAMSVMRGAAGAPLNNVYMDADGIDVRKIKLLAGNTKKEAQNQYDDSDKTAINSGVILRNFADHFTKELRTRMHSASKKNNFFGSSLGGAEGSDPAIPYDENDELDVNTLPEKGVSVPAGTRDAFPGKVGEEEREKIARKVTQRDYPGVNFTGMHRTQTGGDNFSIHMDDGSESGASTSIDSIIENPAAVAAGVHHLSGKISDAIIAAHQKVFKLLLNAEKVYIEGVMFGEPNAATCTKGVSKDPKLNWIGFGVCKIEINGLSLPRGANKNSAQLVNSYWSERVAPQFTNIVNSAMAEIQKGLLKPDFVGAMEAAADTHIIAGHDKDEEGFRQRDQHQLNKHGMAPSDRSGRNLDKVQPRIHGVRAAAKERQEELNESRTILENHKNNRENIHPAAKPKAQSDETILNRFKQLAGIENND